MREYYLALDSCFKNGLRPTKSLPKSPQFMSCLLNGRPTAVGLEPYIPVTKNTNYTWDWPFPQLFITNKHQLLGSRNSLSIIDNANTITDVSNDIWDVISYYDYVIAAKSGSFVGIRDISTGAWTKNTASSDYPIFKTGCDFKGQAVVGNLKDWPVVGDVRANWIAASNIGEFKFTISRKNTASYRPMHWSGEVLCIRRLGNIVMVYGDDGIAGLFTKDQHFGMKELTDFGIYGAGAVGCSRDRHVFLGSDMKLRSIDESMKIKELDFSEYMELLSGTVMISYRPLTDDFFISDGTYSYVLAGEKLYESYQLVTSCGSYGSSTLAAYYDKNTPYFLGVTDAFDFNLRTRKTITTIELGIEGSGVYSVAVDWKNKPSDAFVRTAFVPANDNGVATIPTSGIDFRLCIKCDDYADLKISYATVRYKLTDMTSIRGVYAPPPRGQDAG